MRSGSLLLWCPVNVTRTSYGSIPSAARWRRPINLLDVKLGPISKPLCTILIVSQIWFQFRLAWKRRTSIRTMVNVTVILNRIVVVVAINTAQAWLIDLSRTANVENKSLSSHRQPRRPVRVRRAFYSLPQEEEKKRAGHHDDDVKGGNNPQPTTGLDSGRYTRSGVYHFIVFWKILLTVGCFLSDYESQLARLFISAMFYFILFFLVASNSIPEIASDLTNVSRRVVYNASTYSMNVLTSHRRRQSEQLPSAATSLSTKVFNLAGRSRRSWWNKQHAKKKKKNTSKNNNSGSIFFSKKWSEIEDGSF